MADQNRGRRKLGLKGIATLVLAVGNLYRGMSGEVALQAMGEPG